MDQERRRTKLRGKEVKLLWWYHFDRKEYEANPTGGNAGLMYEVRSSPYCAVLAL